MFGLEISQTYDCPVVYVLFNLHVALLGSGSPILGAELGRGVPVAAVGRLQEYAAHRLFGMVR
jgi:hypothetical protein